MPDLQSATVLAGIAAPLVLWLAGVILSPAARRSWNPFALARDRNADDPANAPVSVSLLQALIWTYVALSAYAMCFAHNLVAAKGAAVGFPTSLMIAMGIAYGTGLTARAVTESAPPTSSLRRLKPKGMLFDSADRVDVSKAQVLAWTIVGAIAYLTQVISVQSTIGAVQLPEVDGALLLLMGATGALYLGNKVIDARPAKEDA